ncbi:MAG: MFS transporter [Candidatus Kerfeldbacteria bacterium]
MSRFRLTWHFPHYFKKHLSVQLEELYLTSAITDFAVSALTLFEPIYLWSLGYRIRELMLYYCMLYVLYFFLVPLGGKFVARFGHERSILISTVWMVGYYAALMAIADVSAFFYIAPVFYALQKTFYWPAYHFDFIRFSVKEERATEYSGIAALSTIMYTIGPIAGGVITKFFGFNALFFTGIVAILLSSIPLFAITAPPKREEFSYWKSFILPFRKRYHRTTLAYLSLGNELILMTVWPVFMLLVLGDILDVGVLVGVSALFTAIITLIIGKWTDRTPKRNVLAVGGLGTMAIWMLRIVSRIPPLVLALEWLGRPFYNSAVVSMTSMTYDRAHEDDYSWHGVLYEQGYAIAKSLIALAVFFLASITDPFAAAFVLAALVSPLYCVF